MYLPDFLWTTDCKRRGVHPFWELINLISRSDSNLFGMEVEPDNSAEDSNISETHVTKENDNQRKVPCILCGLCICNEELDEHLSKCNN